MPRLGVKSFSLEERKTIERLLKEGLSRHSIAIMLNRSSSGLRTEVARNGGAENYSAAAAQANSIQIKTRRLNKIKKTFSPHQLTIISEGVIEKLSVAIIASSAGCSKAAIRTHFRDNNISYLPRNSIGFERRLQAVETKVEIMMDIIKEMKASQ